MRDAVICEPLRTPIGRFGGTLKTVPPVELAATAIRALVERTGLPGDAVDEVILGHCYPTADAPRSDASPRWTPGCPSPSAARRSTGAAGPGCRPSWTRPCRSRPASAT